MTAPLRFGIVGCGVIGATHAEAISSLPDAQLVAVTDNDPGRAEKLASRYNVPAYNDLQEMLRQEQLDVANVCTPSGMHGGQAIAIMRSGVNVIVEKPLDIKHEMLDEVLAVQKETGRKLAVISQHRFDSSSQQVKQLIVAGSFGRLVLGNAAVPWWRSADYYKSGDWRGTRALDGGVLMNQAIHSIDVLQWLMGPVKSVFAYNDTLAHEIEMEDVAVAVLRFASGALGTISATTGGYPGDLTRIEVFGDKGSAVIDNNNLAYLRYAGQEQEQDKEDAAARISNSGGSVAPQPAPGSHTYQIADMIQAIRENRDPVIDGAGGRQPVDIILAIYESAQNKRAVTL